MYQQLKEEEMTDMIFPFLFTVGPIIMRDPITDFSLPPPFALPTALAFVRSTAPY
jgi:hypothetical protein